MSENSEISQSIGVISALIIDDSAFDRRRLMRVANDTNLEFLLREAADPETFGAMLDVEKYDVIFVDLDLSASASGLDLAPIVRAHSVNSGAAMIMIAGHSDADVALNALRCGFADYIDKDTLSVAALERATINAVQKTRLSNAAEVAHQETRCVESVLASFATVCQREMRPMLTRMVRQVRQMRTELDAAGVAGQNILNIEKTCARMDEFLQDLGDLANEGQLEQIVATPQQTKMEVAEKPAPIRPRPIVPKPDVIAKRPRRERSVFGRDQ